MFLHGKMNSRTHPLGPSLEAIGGGSDPLPATQRSAFIMRPNPSLAPPPTNTAPESTAFPLCAAVGHECNLARTPRARCAQWRVRQIRAGRPTMRRAAVQHAVQAARRCRRICNVIGMILVDTAVFRHPTAGVLYYSTASRKRFTCVCPEGPAAAPCRLDGVLHGGAAHRWAPGANLGNAPLRAARARRSRKNAFMPHRGAKRQRR